MTFKWSLQTLWETLIKITRKIETRSRSYKKKYDSAFKEQKDLGITEEVWNPESFLLNEVIQKPVEYYNFDGKFEQTVTNSFLCWQSLRMGR